MRGLKSKRESQDKYGKEKKEENKKSDMVAQKNIIGIKKKKKGRHACQEKNNSVTRKTRTGGSSREIRARYECWMKEYLERTIPLCHQQRSNVTSKIWE